MKRLTVLRHAKSSLGGAGLDDFDRPLNASGIAAARALGKELKQRAVAFDHVLASPAKRVRETLELFVDGYGELPEALFDQAIYLASPATLLDRVRDLPDDVKSPLLVGHNPGLELLVIELTNDDRHAFRDRVAQGYPSGALATLEFPTANWAEIHPGSGEIVELVLPRELS